MELPDFHIPHLEKIEWMIETNGWALESVASNVDQIPPSPAYSYTLGLPALLGFPEIAIFGIKPAAAMGLIGLVIEHLRTETEVPVGVELLGLLDNDLRCMFAVIDDELARAQFATATAWYEGETYPVAQMYYPDRNGFMPYEDGFDARMRHAQPLIGTVPS